MHLRFQLSDSSKPAFSVMGFCDRQIMNFTEYLKVFDALALKRMPFKDRKASFSISQTNDKIRR